MWIGVPVDSEAMRVFGIDCGTEYTGWGVVELVETARETRLLPIAAGAVKLDKKQRTPLRLHQVHSELSGLIALYGPEVVAIEDVFFAANAKSALKLGHVRGVAMLAAAGAGLEVAEYAPLSIKSAVVGYGLAAKEQVQFMVARLLDLERAPEPADAADALAIAICHIHTARTLLGMTGGASRTALAVGVTSAASRRSSAASPVRSTGCVEPARGPVARPSAVAGQRGVR